MSVTENVSIRAPDQRATRPRRRLALLPPNSPLGWTPYAWLVYLTTFLIEPIARTHAGRAGLLYWTATILAMVVFLASYFRGHWLRGVRLIPIVVLHGALGVAFAPINTGSAVFFVYAASFAANMDRTRDAVRALIVLVLVAAATALATDAPAYFWVVGIGITLLVGGVNLHFSQAGKAQNKLRLAQKEIEHLAAVAERERIARDLHDVLGHTLSLIVLKAELAAKLAERDAGRAATEMRDVEAVARKTLQEVREAIRGYHATLGDEVGRALAMLKAGAIEAAFDVVPMDLPRATEETLAFALREAITNVVRHSGAARCAVRLHREDDEVVLTIEDDGRGARAPEGAGLRGMRERVEVFGGSVSRAPGAGMRLRIVMPALDPPTAGAHASLPGIAS